jgi:hypothetical protein
METQRDSLRERLLAQGEPDSGRLAVYRKEMQAMLEQNERTLRRQKWYAGGIWVFAVLMTTTFLMLGGMRKDTPVGVFWGIFGCVLLIIAAVELLKYFLNRTRTELLKEMKGLEVQLLEIKDQLRVGRR